MLKFELKTYELLLKSYSDVRTPGILDLDHTHYMENYILISSGTRNIPMTVNKPESIDGMFPLHDKTYAPPSFTTSAMKRTYGLELRAIISWIGNESKFKVNLRSVTLYPPRMADGVEEAIRAIEEGAGNVVLNRNGGHARLPSYQDHPQTERIHIRPWTEELPGYQPND